jgi:uncharacterized phage-associated protein
MHYNEEKATAAACFFLEKAGGELEDLKLMKLMYLADREALRQRGSSITGDHYYSMKNGPILSETLDRMTPRDQIDSASVWREHIELPEKWEIRLKQPYYVSKSLSAGEISILETTWKRYGRLSKWKLVQLTHELAEWHDPSDSCIPISLAEIYVGLGLEEDQIEARMSAHRADDAMSLAISEARGV